MSLYCPSFHLLVPRIERIQGAYNVALREALHAPLDEMPTAMVRVDALEACLKRLRAAEHEVLNPPVGQAAIQPIANPFAAASLERARRRVTRERRRREMDSEPAILRSQLVDDEGETVTLQIRRSVTPMTYGPLWF